jgi:hypothetical protein
MSTAWTLAAVDVCTDALEHMGILGAGEVPSGEDMQVALRALDAVLKELPLAGYAWPKLAAEAALAWAGGQSIPMPADYFGSPVVWRAADVKKAPLIAVPHGRWVQMVNRNSAVGVPTHFYVAPDNTISLWPTPSTDPGLTLQYQRIVNDVSGKAQPDVPQYMLNALGYGVAHECVLKFDTPPARAQEIAQRWMVKRAAALEYAIESAPICFEVRD